MMREQEHPHDDAPAADDDDDDDDDDGDNRPSSTRGTATLPDVTTSSAIEKESAAPSTKVARATGKLRARIREQLDKFSSSDHHYLYDRESQSEEVLRAYKLVKSPPSSNMTTTTMTMTTTAAKTVLITGPDGSGKTSVARSLKDHVRRDGGYYLFGRFEEGGEGQLVMPFCAFADAFTQLVRQIQGGPKEEADRVRKAIEARVLAGGQVLSNVIPALTEIIDLKDGSNKFAQGRAASTRFVAVCSSLIRAICSIKPLVIVLDDVDRADACSLSLLKTLAEESDNCLFVLTCSDAKLQSDGPLKDTLRSLRDEGNHIKEIHLEGIRPESVGGLLSDLLCMAKQDLRYLVEMFSSRTKGNPGLILEILQRMETDHILRYDTDLQEWTWSKSEAEEFFARPLTAKGLATEKVGSMPPQLKELLRTASCLGSKLDEMVLTCALSAPVAHYLQMGTYLGVLAIDPESNEYYFAHDSMRQASYELIEETNRAAVHLAIGRKLRRSLSRDCLLDNIFVVLDQMSRGTKAMSSRREKHSVAELCLRGSERAVSACSFRLAAACLTLGIRLLGRDSFSDDYELSLALHTTGAEVYYAVADPVRMDECIDAVLTNARCFQDKLGVYTTQVYSLGTQDRGCEAISVAQHVLEQLGERFPSSFHRFHLFREFSRVRKLLRGKTSESILRLPEMTDPNKLAAMQLLSVTFLQCYISEAPIAPFVALRMVRLTLENGLCAISSFGFSLYGLILCGATNNMEECCRFAQLGLKVVDKYNAKEWIPRVYAICYGCLYSFRDPIAETLKPLLYAHEVGLETGDLEYSMVSANLYCFNALQLSNLSVLQDKCEKFERIMVAQKQELALALMEPYKNMVEVLTGKSDYSHAISCDPHANAKISSPAAKTDMCKAVIWFDRLLVAYIFNDLEAARELAILCYEKIVKKPLATFEVCDFQFYAALTSAAVVKSTGDRMERRRHMHVLQDTTKRMKKWAKDSPNNCLSKLFLLQAEEASIMDRPKRARAKYTCAMSVARTEGFMLENSIAMERAARDALLCGDNIRAAKLFRDACESYKAWGAHAKARDLREEMTMNSFLVDDSALKESSGSLLF